MPTRPQGWLSAHQITLASDRIFVGITVAIPKGHPDAADLAGSAWDQLAPLRSQIPHPAGDPFEIGVSLPGDAHHDFRYFAGIEVDLPGGAPEALETFVLPAGDYAACTFTAPTFEEMVAGALLPSATYLHQVVLPAHHLVRDEHAPMTLIEVYTAESFAESNPRMQVWFPVRRSVPPARRRASAPGQ